MRIHRPLLLRAFFILSGLLPGFGTAAENPFGLKLPTTAVADRVSVTDRIAANQKRIFADLDGPGCIKHIWMTLRRPGKDTMLGRKIVIRIYFDDATTPNVEAPVSDFFGVMNGADYYELNNQFLDVKQFNGYNCYFEMPFAKRARVELENGPENGTVYLQVDWHRYPDNDFTETRRFCAQWRRENPTERYGKDYLMLDADGPGQLVGYAYGVRLIDDADRWSHGGAANIYLDGFGAHPAYVRGIGGEDDFGTSYGGVLHAPETHLYASMPYYVLEDVGEARGAQRVAGYRFFVTDQISFKESIHVRFGSMANDICSTVYWYQNGAPRRFADLPDWKLMLPATELRAGAVDLKLPDQGSWSVGGLLENANGEAIQHALDTAAPRSNPAATWVTENSNHGFIDFNHIHRPNKRGVGIHYAGKAAEARATFDAPEDLVAKFELAWDDQLVIRVNDAKPIDLGVQSAFRDRTIEVPLKKGKNQVMVTLSNEKGSNHGGWAFSLHAMTPKGENLVPRAENVSAAK